MPKTGFSEELCNLLSRSGGDEEDSTDSDGSSDIFTVSDSDKTGQDDSVKRFNQTGKNLLCVLYLDVCVCISFYVALSSKPYKVLHPTNNKGEICGLGDQSGKPNLLYLDLTQCAGLNATQSGCP